MSAAAVEEGADAVRRFTEFKSGDGVRCERAILSTDDLEREARVPAAG